MYCAWRIPAHLRCTQCSILLHLMDICFLTCICLWQISQIQTFLFKVVGPGLVSTSPAFVSSNASHPAGPHGRHAKKTVNRAPIADLYVCFANLIPLTFSHDGIHVTTGLYTFYPSFRFTIQVTHGLVEYGVEGLLVVTLEAPAYMPSRNAPTHI